MKVKILVIIVVLFNCVLGKAQDNPVFQDVNSLVRETQRVITVEPRQKIDTAYFRTLFLPSAHFSVVGQENGEYMQETMGLDEFIMTLTDEYYTNGYHEVGTGEIIEEYNGMAQVIQSFEGQDSEGESGKGVGSYQLVYSEGRWWIANMVWAISVDDGKDIPAKYLKN